MLGKAIVTGIVIIVVLLILAGVWIWTKRHDFKGDLSQGEEKHMRELVTEAAMIFTSMGPDAYGALDDADFLSHRSKTAIKGWMDKYQKNRREFESA